MATLRLPAKRNETPPPAPPLEVDWADVRRSFLRSFLSDGPRLRTYVYREAEDRGLDWEGVRLAFADLHGREYIQKGECFWRIMPD
jgi:hypothetical protein